MNNADLGMTFQSRVCTLYNLEPNETAKKQFNAAYNNDFKEDCDKIIDKIFNEIGLGPIKCTSFESSEKIGEKFKPYNFILEGNKTLSIRTSKNSKMICPRVVGQAGYEVLNSFFKEYSKNGLFTQEQIRKTVYKNINEMLPTFVSYLLNSDYTVWVYQTSSGLEYFIVDNNTAVDIEYKKRNFDFTRDLSSWKESNTLKYNGISIAEVQTHKNRTFKFRFNFPNLIKLFVETKFNNETIGITAENCICDLFSLKKPSNFENRISKTESNKMLPTIKEAFKNMPDAIQHTGSDSGIRLGNSKCPYDFLLKGNKTLSLKTNTGKMVCPPEVGQPNDSTFYLYFKDLISETYVNEEIFKNLVFNKPEKLIPIYLNHLFDSDYLLRLSKNKNKWSYEIYQKGYGSGFDWKKENFNFSKTNICDWNESNTIKYQNIRLGEFQYHHHRNCYKFRFDFDNLIKILNNF